MACEYQQYINRVISSSPFRPGVTYDLTASPVPSVLNFPGVPPPGPLLQRIQKLEDQCNEYACTQIKLEAEIKVLKRSVEELYKAKPRNEPPPKRTTEDVKDAVLSAPPLIRRVSFPVYAVTPPPPPTPLVPKPSSVIEIQTDWKKKITEKYLFYGGSPPRPIPELTRFPSPSWEDKK
jgi:hypothetical protein